MTNEILNFNNILKKDLSMFVIDLITKHIAHTFLLFLVCVFKFYEFISFVELFAHIAEVHLCSLFPIFVLSE